MFKAGLIGLGRMGITHLAILNSHPDVRFVAACDQARFQTNALAGRMGLKAYRDVRRMLDECQPDFVVIATPAESHAEIAREAISRDMHLFIEKPLTLNADDSRELAEILDGTRLVNQVGYMNRSNAVFREAKRLISEGMLGDIRHVKSEMYGRTVLKDFGSSWRSKRSRGGGCLYEFASHCIDLVVFLMGPPDDVIGSLLQSVYSSQTEDAVYANFVYDNGATATIQTNWSDASYRKPANRVEVFGTEGKLIADRHQVSVFLRRPDEKGRFEQGWNTRYITDLAEPVRFYLRGYEYTTQLDHFVDCLKNPGRSNVCTCRDAMNTDVVIERMFAGNHLKATVNG